jgi:hypothetical protein
MDIPGWLALAVTVPAALVLLTICIGSALRLSPAAAGRQQSALMVVLGLLMIVVAGDHLLHLRQIPVLGFLVNLAKSAGGMAVVYSLIVAITILFRRGCRATGFQMLVCVAMAIWWMALVEPGPGG